MAKQKGSNNDKPVDDPLERSLSFLLRERDEFLTLLKKSEKWPIIAPELQAAADKIEEGYVVHGLKICLRLGEEGVPEADLFNLNGLLSIQMALFEVEAIVRASNGSINQLMSDLALHLFMAGGASQQHRGVVPVRREFQRIGPLLERDLLRQEGCSTGGRQSGIIRREECKDRNSLIVKLARDELSSGRDRGGIVSRLATRFSLSPRQIRNILNNHGI